MTLLHPTYFLCKILREVYYAVNITMTYGTLCLIHVLALQGY